VATNKAPDPDPGRPDGYNSYQQPWNPPDSDPPAPHGAWDFADSPRQPTQPGENRP
jgi:hypothetical protein